MARNIIAVCDWISVWSGKTVSWLIFPLMFTITYEVICRYVFNAPTVWAYDMTYMIGGTMMALGMGFVLKEKGHVRVDILYDRFPAKVKSILDLVLTALFFFPITFFFIQQSWQYAVLSWVRNERSGYGIWEPTLIPFRFMVVVAWSLLFIAGIAWFLRSLVYLTKGKEL